MAKIFPKNIRSWFYSYQNSKNFDSSLEFLFTMQNTFIDPVYLVSDTVLLGDLKSGQYFSSLTEKQQKYATYISLANFASSLSDESPKIHAFLSYLLPSLSSDMVHSAFSSPSETNLPLRQLIEYAAVFYQCSSNYRGFGDTKFIPRLSKEGLISLIDNCQLDKTTHDKALDLLNQCISSMYSLDPPSVRSQGFSPTGVTRYYLPSDFTQNEVLSIDSFLCEHHIRVENTTIVRDSSKQTYYVNVYSIDESEEKLGTIPSLNNFTIILKKGFHSNDLRRSVKWLQLARQYCASEIQEQMIDSLILHYTHGNIEDHVKYSSLWVSDTDPAVESHMGFIETYRDPQGVRAEFEGIVACVDSKESIILKKFVEASNIVLPLLPYPKEYERSQFSPPTYNALQILTACINDYPIGINIPNYDEIRMHIGFKNVTLMNVKNAQIVHVACHELYGHGSGRLFTKDDIKKGIPDLLTPTAMVQSYYEDGVSYDKAFGPIGSSFEECRAETTAMYLILNEKILDIFDISKEDQKGFMISEIYYLMKRSFVGLLNYDPKTMMWKQAHARGRFAILRALLMWSRGGLTVIRKNNSFEIVVNKEKLDGVRDGLALMLKHLNYYKATCQVTQAEAFYSALTSVDNYWLEVRKIVENIPKREVIIAQATIVKENDQWTLIGKENPDIYDAAMTVIQNVQAATSE